MQKQMQMQMQKQTSLFENGLIWFGAAVSIAEILTGTYFAPLGLSRALIAIFIGHLIGCILLFLSGVIGGKMRKSAMQSCKDSFGTRGGLLFAALNVLQLLGWTAIMVYDGALAANGIFNISHAFWCFVIGLLIIAWILIGVRNLGKVNIVAMAVLFILTIILCKIIFFSGNSAVQLASDTLSFGAAVELAIAMPLSWLPLISDYTREARQPVKASAVSTIVYGLVSCWMYIIGMGAASFAGNGDIAQIMLKAGLGVAGLVIVVFSTVTTTFLDAYSAGVSAESIFSKINGKYAGVVVAAIGTAAAIVFPMDDITDFLYLIGSVFAPMIAIQIADFFILKKAPCNSNDDNANAEKLECCPSGNSGENGGNINSDENSENGNSHYNTGALKNPAAFNWCNLLIWLFGFGLYRFMMQIDLSFGNTAPTMLAVIIICCIINFGVKRFRKSRK